MIIWIASYPKSGNTWVRALLSYYFFSKEERFNFDILKHIPNFNIGDFVSTTTRFKSDVDFADKALEIQKFICKNSKVNVFFKTHSCLKKIDKHKFTDESVSLGCVYIVRDPRNVISSYMNYENWDYTKTLDFMINEKSFLFSNKKTQAKLGIKGKEIISSWSENYNSWVKNKFNMPVCLVKYEDLIKNPLEQLEKMFEFIKKINSEKKIKFELKRASKTINETTFEKLQSIENINGFEENDEHGRKNKFFYKGKMNDWKNSLPKNIEEKLIKNFKNEMLELGYLK